MRVVYDIPDNAEDIVLMYKYKTAEGDWIHEGRTFTPKRCGLCMALDFSCMYGSNPPEYKCGRYGCIVKVTDVCKGENNAEKQEQEKASQ